MNELRPVRSPERQTDDIVLISSGTFECPPESDGSLLLSTVQSQIPQASGLWYSTDGSDRRRAIRYDKRTDKLIPPADGWKGRVYTVSFYNNSGFSCIAGNRSFDRYERATKTFCQSVNAVERLFDVEFDTVNQTDAAKFNNLKKEVSRLRERNAVLEDEKRQLEKSLEEKNALLGDKLSLENVDVESVFLKQAMKLIQEKDSELQRLLNENLALRNELSTNDREMEMEEFVKTENAMTKSENETVSNGVENGAEPDEDLKALLSDKDCELMSVKQRLYEKEESLQELTKQLDDTKWRYTELETLCDDYQSQLETFKTDKYDDLRWKLHEQTSSASLLQKENDELHNEITTLNEKYATAQDQLGSSQQLNDRLKSELEVCQNKLSEIQVQDQTKPVDELAGNIQQSLENLQRLYDTAKWSQNFRVGELEEEVAWKETELQRVRCQCDQTETQSREVEATLETYQSRIAELEALVAKLQKEIAERQNESQQQSSMKEELDELRRCMRSMEAWSSSSRIEQLPVRTEPSFNEKDELMELRSVYESLYGKEQDRANLQLTVAVTQQRVAELEEENRQLTEHVRVLEDENIAVQERNNFRNEVDALKSRERQLLDELRHWKHLFEDTSERLRQLEYATTRLEGSFIVRKEAFIDRHKWNLCTWSEQGADQYGRVWYELDAPHASSVYLAVSFFNWECLLLMAWHEHGKWGVWIDAPRGHHQFRFLVDGEWRTSDQFPQCPNDYGDSNNFRSVD